MLKKMPIIVICGPTATGKTAISIRLAKEINAEIINFDSVQLYKRVDIGSAKPTKDELEEVKHHLISVLDLDEHFDASLFECYARNLIDNIKKRGKNVILVGGTGLYLRALIEGLVQGIPSDYVLREELRAVSDQHGSVYLHDLLKKIDPISAKRIHPNDEYRIIRALEVYRLTGKPLSTWFEESKAERAYKKLNFFKIGLILPREELHRRIDERVDKMLEMGLIDEVKGILEDGFSPNLKPLNTVGYKEIIMYLKGEITLEKAIRWIKRNTKNLAKRQITWFRKEPLIKWFNPNLIKTENLWKFFNS